MSARKFRRILLAIDASPQSRAALRAAVELAARLRAELLALFVEDINLVRMAGIPPTREIGRISGRSRNIDEQRLLRQLRAQAAASRRQLERAAQPWDVKWSFEVARGRVEEELLQQAHEADLMILGRSGWSKRQPIGSTAEAMLESPHQNTMVIASDNYLQPTYMVAFDGSERAERALETAIGLAEGSGGYLVIGVVADDSDSASELQSKLTPRLEAVQLQVRYRWLINLGTSGLGEMIRGQEQCVLVLPDQSPILEGKSVSQALEDLDCPILLIP